jgi:hypothetical protein
LWKDWSISRKNVGMMSFASRGHQLNDCRKAFEATTPDLEFITEGHKLSSDYSNKKRSHERLFPAPMRTTLMRILRAQIAIFGCQ